MRHLATLCLALVLLVWNLPAFAAEAAPAQAGTNPPEMSVLDRFRTYTGHRTVEGFADLFKVPANAVLRQQPLISLSDGSSAVILAIKMPSPDGMAPNFSLNGAVMLSLQHKTADEWQMKVLPAKGVSQASLIVVVGPAVREFPITVAPPLPAGTTLTEAGFHAFVNEAIDVNRDGRTDYLDDYIFTANFLAMQRTSGRDKSARRERALQRTLAVKPGPQEIEYNPELFGDAPPPVQK